MIPPVESLLKYDHPALIKTKFTKPLKELSLKENSQLPVHNVLPAPPQAKSAASEAAEQDIQNILNGILPPRSWEEEGELWLQQVSSAPSIRADVIKLEESLDIKLERRQATDTGICPVRRELYSQCFDELIRQVTINCTERGLLLLRIRNEIQTTLAALHTLYQSSIAFGISKALIAEKNKADMEKRVAELENEIENYKKKLDEQKAQCDAIEKREAEKRQIEDQKHQGEIEFLQRSNELLKAQLQKKTPT